MLVAAVAVVANALPSPQDDPTIHQPTEEEQQADEAAFLALPIEERLAARSLPAQDLQAHGYGQMRCKYLHQESIDMMPV